MSSNGSIRSLYKVLITQPAIPASVLEYLRSKGCQTIVCENEPPKKSEILQKVLGVDAIFWAHCHPLNAEILDAAGKNLKAVSTMTSGIDYVDLQEFRRRKIPMGHTPNIVGKSVAELTISLMIAAGRHFHEGRQEIEK